MLNPMDRFASPDTLFPVILPDGSPHQGTVFLRPATRDHPQFQVGDYTYASAHVPPADWAAKLAPYLYPFSPETLKIGKFCQIADGVQFITASANHRYDGFSSYPFGIFGGGLAGSPAMPFVFDFAPKRKDVPDVAMTIPTIHQNSRFERFAPRSR